MYFNLTLFNNYSGPQNNLVDRRGRTANNMIVFVCKKLFISKRCSKFHIHKIKLNNHLPLKISPDKDVS